MKWLPGSLSIGLMVNVVLQVKEGEPQTWTWTVAVQLMHQASGNVLLWNTDAQTYALHSSYANSVILAVLVRS